MMLVSSKEPSLMYAAAKTAGARIQNHSATRPVTGAC